MLPSTVDYFHSLEPWVKFYGTSVALLGSSVHLSSEESFCLYKFLLCSLTVHLKHITVYKCRNKKVGN